MTHSTTAGNRRLLSFQADYYLTQRLDAAAQLADVSRSELIRTAASRLADQVLDGEPTEPGETLPELEPVALGQ